MIFDRNGTYSFQIMRAVRPAFVAESRMEGTAEENKATAEGTITYFGTYSVSEADSSIAIHIDASSFPNWNGADQKRNVTITGNQLTLTARALPTGGRAEVIWNRAN